MKNLLENRKKDNVDRIFAREKKDDSGQIFAKWMTVLLSQCPDDDYLLIRLQSHDCQLCISVNKSCLKKSLQQNLNITTKKLE